MLRNTQPSTVSKRAVQAEVHTSDSELEERQLSAVKDEREALQQRLTDLWGPARTYPPVKEETANLFQRLYFGWVYDTVILASRERLTKEALPLPMNSDRCRDCGKRMSDAIQEALRVRHAWDNLIGSKVVSREDASSKGVLRWVGVPQQGGFTRVMAAVEWEVAPAARVAARSECGDNSPFFNGVVHGEELFAPAREHMCTLEEVNSIDLYESGDGGKMITDVDVPCRVPLGRLLVRTLPDYIWMQIPFELLGTVCALSGPMIIKRFVAFLNDESKEKSWGVGLGLVFALFVTLAGQSFFVQRYNYASCKCGLQHRSALNSLIFEKCFTISSKALTHPEMSAGRVINMVGTDVERVYFFTMFAMELWNAPLKLFVCMAMLGSLVGWTSIMALLAFLATLPINAHYTNVQMECRRQLAKVTDSRVKATNEFLSGIRVAKFMAWEPRFIANVEAKRASELYYLKKIQYCRIATFFLNTATPLIMIAIVFVLYSFHDELTPEVVFPSIAILALLRQPFMQIPWVLTMAAQCFISLGRIRNFLECNNSSCATVEDIEKYFPNEKKAAEHNIFCGVAAVFQHTDITAYAPIKLPFIETREQGLIHRFSRRFCCELCRPASLKPSLNAFTAPPQSPRTPSSPTLPPSAAGPNGNSRKPMAQKDEFFQLEPKVLLQDLSVQIPSGKLTVVLGATGCGKTTLLNSLLGQFEVTRGRVWAMKSIAYVPQQPWIMNATVRDNILFFSEEDAARLDSAVRVSQMETDLGLLAAGLETEIGEKGINLSGGQKARVSLARAVYADRDMYLLDDPLSALDAHVGERIVNDCILGQLAGKTRVLATHQLHVVPKADYVIVLDEHRVAYRGPASEFTRTDLFKTMSATAAEEEERAEEEAEAEGEATAKPVDGPGAPQEAAVDEEGGDANDAGGVLTTSEEKAKGGVPWATYLVYFDHCGGTATAVTTLAVYFVTEVLAVSSSVWLSLWSVDYYHMESKRYLTWYLVLVLISTAGNPTRLFVAYHAMRRGCNSLHRTILRSVAAGTMEFFDRTPLGRIMNRFSRDIDVIDNGLQMSMTSTLDCFFSIASSICITLVSQPLVILALIPCAYCYVRIMLFFNAANREIRRNTSVMKSPVYTLLGELTTGGPTISAYGKSSVIMKEAMSRLDVVYSCDHLGNATNRWLAVRIEFISATLATSIAFFGVISAVVGFGNVALISLSLTMAMQTTGQLNWLVRQSAAMEADMNSVERIQYYTDEIPHEDMPELSDEVDKLEIRGGVVVSGDTAEVVIEASSPTTPAAHVVRAGSLEFRGVQMRYREGLPLVLRDVSFRIAPREKVGIVGRTGSGKSTLLLTFMRMVDICGGEIVVSGQAIRSYPLRELRRQFSMIPQDPVLFDGTVRLNVDPFLEASSAEVWDALELVGLRERIASELEGIDGRVLEGGSNFSVGQRQLLCMARALLKKGSGFILMDEATANIDQSLDRHIQGTVMKAFGAYTVITIAHRLQTVAQYDKIIVMDQGAVAEMGSPRELVERRGSVFHDMVESMGPGAVTQFMNLLAGKEPLGDELANASLSQ